jgi:hypothetical protein
MRGEVPEPGKLFCHHEEARKGADEAISILKPVDEERDGQGGIRTLETA